MKSKFRNVRAIRVLIYLPGGGGGSWLSLQVGWACSLSRADRCHRAPVWRKKMKVSKRTCTFRDWKNKRNFDRFQVGGKEKINEGNPALLCYVTRAAKVCGASQPWPENTVNTTGSLMEYIHAAAAPLSFHRQLHNPQVGRSCSIGLSSPRFH